MVDDIILKEEFGTRFRLNETGSGGGNGILNLTRNTLLLRLTDSLAKHYRNFTLCFCILVGVTTANFVHIVIMGGVISAIFTFAVVVFNCGVLCWDILKYLNAMEEKVTLMRTLKDTCELHSRG